MALRASVWPLARVPPGMSMSWKLLLSLPPPEADSSGTSAAGRYSGRLKASLDRSPGLKTEPALSVIWVRAKVLPLAIRWPPLLTVSVMGV